MAAGQSVLRSTLDVGEVNAVESRLSQREQGRHAAHADALRDALELHRLYDAAGMGLATPAQLALVWRCSETRATALLTAAQLLVELPDAFALLDDAVMTVEQSAAVARAMQPLEPAVRDAVWDRVRTALIADAGKRVQRPPARLTAQMRRWAVEVDAAAAVERRRRAEREGNVLLQRRDDGLVDVLLAGMTAPDAEACLSRITAGADPFGADDDRPAGKRRLDAAVDLLLGRTGRPAGEHGDGCVGSCECALGAAVPCGASVMVLVPLATALGLADVPAELAGHGPLEPDLLQALLRANAELRVVFVDDDGQPVSDSDTVERPGRTGDEGVHAALLRLLASQPGPRQPRHPDDHAPTDEAPPDEEPPDEEPPDDEPPDDPPDDPPDHPPAPASPSASSRRRPRVRTRPHPVGTSGPYRAPARLRRFVAVRAPRCEWPGCGARASRCDDDHDVAWPAGPTCPCNIGPLCRRHHRIKQLGWQKERTRDGVRWTTPTGGEVLAPNQSLGVAAPGRGEPPRTSPLDELSPPAREHELWSSDPSNRWFDGLDTDASGLAAMRSGERAAEERWWAGELAGLRRQAFGTRYGQGPLHQSNQPQSVAEHLR